MPRARRWTDEQLRDAVAASTSWFQVLKALELVPAGGSYAVVRRHAVRLGLDIRHLPLRADGHPGKPRRFSDEELRAAVAECTTVAAVLRRLGYHPSGGMHRYMAAEIRELRLDASHFVGQGWAKGRPNPRAFRGRPLEEWLVDGSSIGGSRLLRRLIEAGLKGAACEACGRTEWEGAPIPLHLDHINGVPTDNRLENLRALCPNCHALTPTYCGRNRGRVVERQTRSS